MNTQTENQIQYEFFKLARQIARADNRWSLIHHINNGAATDRQRVHLHNMGCVSGIPDVFVPYPSKGHMGLYIEFKSAKGKVSTQQQLIMSALESRGYKTVVCKSADSAVDAVMHYLGKNIFH